MGIYYKYNDSGHRTEKTANEVVTKYYHNEDKVVLESTDSNSICYFYNADDKLVSMALKAWSTFTSARDRGI